VIYILVTVEHQSSHFPENCTLTTKEVIISGKVISQLRSCLNLINN